MAVFLFQICRSSHTQHHNILWVSDWEESLALKLPWVTKKEFLLTIYMKYEADRWWEYRKTLIRGLLVDQISNSLKWHHKRYMVDSKENLWGHLGSESVDYQGWVFWRLIGLNPRLNFDPGLFISLYKSLSRKTFSILFRASSNHIIEEKNNMEFFNKAFKSEITFHTNPGLSWPSFEQPSPDF